MTGQPPKGAKVGETTSTVARPFRLGEWVKDPYLAKALRDELLDLKAPQLEIAQEAIIEVASVGTMGTYDELLGEYRRAIRRGLEPDRKLVKNPRIDRKVIRLAQLADMLDKELRDVTQPELDAVNAALRKVIEDAKTLTVQGKQGEERRVEHDPTEVCRRVGQHSTIGECGYFRDPAAWPDVFRAVIRRALEG